MEMFIKFKEINIANEVKKELENNYLFSKNKNLNKIKKNLSEKDIIFFNIIKNTKKDIGIMVKTIENTFIYNYNIASSEISLIGGVRKNVNIK